MHWVEVDGIPMPKLIGGHPALDLCNTWAGWGEPPDPRREWIPDFEAFAIWSKHAGLVDAPFADRLRRRARRRVVEGRQIVAKAHSFRRALYAHLTDPADLRSFGRLAPTIRRAAASAEFVLGDDGLAQWAIPSGIGLELPLVTVAWEAGNLLTSTDRLRVGRCPGNDCGWLFLDRSGRRKWCDMASCGNRAKVRAYNKRAKR